MADEMPSNIWKARKLLALLAELLHVIFAEVAHSRGIGLFDQHNWPVLLYRNQAHALGLSSGFFARPLDSLVNLSEPVGNTHAIPFRKLFRTLRARVTEAIPQRLNKIR